LKTLHLHIGSGRCGTTLIQALFNENFFHEAFAQFSTHYDPQIFLALTELVPITKLDKKKYKPIRDDHFAPHKAANYENLFTIQEHLLGLTWEKGKKNYGKKMCDVIEYIADGFDIRLIVSFRRQDSYLESLYNQLVKRGDTRNIKTFLKSIPLENLEWDKVIEPFAKRFGKDHVSVVPFERAVLKQTGLGNFVDGVLSAMNLPINVDLATVPVMNPSLSPRALEVQIVANEKLTEMESLALANWFEKAAPKSPDDKHGLISKAEKNRLIKRFRDSNKRLFEEYLTDYDPAFYMDPIK